MAFLHLSLNKFSTVVVRLILLKFDGVKNPNGSRTEDKKLSKEKLGIKISKFLCHLIEI